MSSGGIRGEVERKQTTCHGFLMKAEFAMNLTKPVLLKKETGTVRLLPQVATTSEFDRHRLPQFFFPALLAEPFQIFISQLHAEVTATIAAPMTGIALVFQIEDLKRNALCHVSLCSSPPTEEPSPALRRRDDFERSFPPERVRHWSARLPGDADTGRSQIHSRHAVQA